jgi:signal transduction histidine kinase
VSVTACEPLLLQVWTNLIGNAIKFSEPRQELFLRLLDQTECAVVSVTDHGCGMTPEKLEEVQREVAGDLGQISEGGFGLPNIQKRIQLAYGADYGIHVSSRLGCGTRVTLQIPAKS